MILTPPIRSAIESADRQCSTVVRRIQLRATVQSYPMILATISRGPPEWNLADSIGVWTNLESIL